MPVIKIREAHKKGELRWCIDLLDNDSRIVLQSAEPLSRGQALAGAKALKHKGRTSGIQVSEELEVKFDLINDTKFRTPDGDTCAENTDAIKVLLAEVEIVWEPPEADPAHKEKQDDRTLTKGIPGS